MDSQLSLGDRERTIHLGMLITSYRENKWIPKVIPQDKILDIEEAFDRLPKKHAIDPNDRTPDFIVERNKAIFLFSYLLALRPLEAVGLKFTDIRINEIGEYFILIRGENNKLGKSRTLPLPNRLINLINTILKDFRYQDFWKNSEWLFPSTQTRADHLSRYQWNDIFQRVIKEAGVYSKHPTRNRGIYTAHSLRHTRAVELLEESGFDIWSVSKLLGHSSLEATMCYLHVCPSIQNHFRGMINK